MMGLRSEGMAIRRALVGLTVIIAALVFGACSLLHRGAPGSAGAQAQPSAEASPQAEGTPAEGEPGQGASNEPNTPPPSATVDLTYSHPGDYLASLSVTKFNGAEMIESRNIDPQHTASIIRFDGGVTVWEMKADNGMFSKLPMLGSGQKFALKSVTYGKLPEHFQQVAPDSGSPEPLETGSYYIFTARRASGILSYEAVRVEPDGSLDGYEAEPRAGTSYVLCCNVSSDFVQPPAPLVPNVNGGP